MCFTSTEHLSSSNINLCSCLSSFPAPWNSLLTLIPLQDTQNVFGCQVETSCFNLAFTLIILLTPFKMHNHFVTLLLLVVDRDRAPRWNLPNRQGDLLAMKHGVAWQADDSSICMLHHVMLQYTLRGVSFLYRTLSISKNRSIVNLCKTCPTTSRNFCGSIPADFTYSSSKKRSTARCFFGNRLLPLARICNKATQTHLFQR